MNAGVKMIFKLIIPLAMICLVMVSIAGCASPAAPITTEADFLGFITEIHPVGKGDVIGQVMAESHADKLVEKYVVTINDKALIFREDGGNLSLLISRRCQSNSGSGYGSTALSWNPTPCRQKPPR